jgi:translation initiation factor 2B subunit (eIF-2B alpha/beta/delta family)
VDAQLARALAAVARDRQSGAAELARRAAAALHAWLRRHRSPAAEELEVVARRLATVQPSMAPLLQLANEVAQLAETGSLRRLPGAVVRFRRLLEVAPGRIARRFATRLRTMHPPIVATYSYSSTVTQALLAARRHLGVVWCSEARPGLEGRRAARELAAGGVNVVLMSDAALFEVVPAADLLVLGADTVQRNGFHNKIGTRALVERRAAVAKPVWVLADTTKFWPDDAFHPRWRFPRAHHPPAAELWRRPPRGVRLWNPYFAPCAYCAHLRVLCERGWLDARRIHRALARRRIAPSLRRLLH